MAASPDNPSPTISTHVLDTERGMPAVGVHVTLSKLGDDGKPVRMTQALTDTDSDGMDDGWEVTYFGNLAATSGADADSDGMTNGL